jgi:nucleoside-diphosphate-sugar epimerase
MGHRVLLSGATGMIGQALLARLVRRSDIEQIFALARHELPVRFPKTRALRADIGALHGCDLAGVCDQLTTIIHAAADVRFAASRTDLWRTNVGGTDNLLAYAASCPRLSRVIFLSTVHVAGRRSGRIAESELEHDCGFVNGYEESKYEAELRTRARMGALPITVVRLSTVIGSSKGEVPRLAAIHHALRFYYHSLAPMIPGTAASPVDLVPLDFACDAILELAFDSFEAGATFHVCSGEDSLSLRDLLDLTMECFLRFRPGWRKRAIEKPAIVDLPTFNLFVRSVEEVGDEGLRSSVAVLKHFAPQLAFPKHFDDRDGGRILRSASLCRPRVRDYFPLVIKELIEAGWRETPEHSLEAACR